MNPDAKKIIDAAKQFEVHSIEDLGLLKIDFLGLKNLTIIEETVRLIKEFEGVDLDISKLPLDDKKAFKILQDGDTTGIFQLESSGMRHYLKELKPTDLEDIIAMVSLYRPGPMELIPSFVNRKHGKEKVTYLHPKLEPILKSTYGIGIYQEQMMRIARDFAGFTLSEADTLRKAIGKKIKALLDAQKENLKVFPPDVNSSFVSFVPENNNIRFGLLAIKNVGENIVEAIIAERQRGGPFENFTDFLNRVRHKDLNKKSLE